jgi:hypothetical protein
MPALNTAPLEVMSSPFALYYAAVGTTFPLVNAVPDSSDWELVGSNGDLNADREPGVVIGLPQSVNSWRSHGDLGTRKRFPTEMDLMIKMRLVDMTVEQMALVLNFNTITTPVAGTKRIGLSRSFTIPTRALVLRFDMSPYMESGQSQFCIYMAQMISSPEIKNAQGVPMGYDLEFSALVNPAAVSDDLRFGYFEAEFTP